MGWWRFTRLALEALTRPKADTASCDRAVEQLARDSRLGGALHRASFAIRAAWLNSRARAAATVLGRQLTGWRVRGWLIAVAGATALGMNAIKPSPAGPLTWLLPSLVIAAGVVIMLIAAPLERALLNRTS